MNTLLVSLKQNPIAYLFRMFWSYSNGNRRKVALYMVMFVVANAINMIAEPYIYSQIISTFTTKSIDSASTQYLIKLVLSLVLLEIVFWSLHGPARIIENNNSFNTKLKFRSHFLNGVMSLPLGWHTGHHSGDTIDKINKGSSAMESFASDSFRKIDMSVKVIGSIAMLVYFCPWSAPIITVMIGLSVWITVQIDKRLIAQQRTLNRNENAIVESIFDTISNITTVVILRVERLVLRTIESKMNEPYSLYKKNNILNEVKWFLTSLCCITLITLVLAVYIYQNWGASAGSLSGEVFLLITYLEKVGTRFYDFTWIYSKVIKERTSISNAEELSRDFREEYMTNHVLPSEWNALNISDLNFSYPDSTRSHLENITFRIHRGERIALIGSTGSGKTTLLKILRGLYTPSTIELSVDGVIVPDGFDGISQAISLIPQTPEIFASTIEYNITLGATYSPEVIRQCCEIACFDTVLSKLGKGIQSRINEKGVNLSGGEVQRLALARGLVASLGSPTNQILLLDEPTASLDAQTKLRVYRGIFETFQDKTIISTVHDLSTLYLFDRVYLFDAGKIIAEGTLDELKLNSEFQILWSNAMNEQLV